MSSNKTELLYKYTHNSSRFVGFCSKRWPCFRDQACNYCWNRRRKYVVDQVIQSGEAWGLHQLLTINPSYSRGNPIDDLQSLAELRSKLHPALQRLKSKYVTVASLKVGSRIIPHLHSLTGALSANTIRNSLPPEIWSGLNINVRPIRMPYEANLKKVTGYILDRNLRETMPFRPKGFRLISSSRGIRTGRPMRTRLGKEMRDVE